MNFKKEVQVYFKTSGWYKGRYVKRKIDQIPRIEEYPKFLKTFFNEYGLLNVPTYKFTSDGPDGTLDLRIYEGWNSIIDDVSSYGGIKMYAIGHYYLDNSTCMCDDEGNVYMIGDVPMLLSNNLKEGIEKVILEDYSDVLEWHWDVKEWKKEEY